MARTWRRLAKDAKGNIVVLFALSLIPILLGIGVAVDFGRALLVHERTNDALDVAALAIGLWSELSQDQLTAKAQQFFDANYSAADLGSVGKINVGFSGGDIKIKHEPPLNSIEWKPSWPTVWRTQRRTARPTARITDAPSGIAASRRCPPKA